MKKIIALVAALALAGCANLSPTQQAALDDLGRVAVRAACSKLESQYAKVGNPSATQITAMDYARAACRDPSATVDGIKSAAKDIVALLPAKVVAP